MSTGSTLPRTSRLLQKLQSIEAEARGILKDAKKAKGRSLLADSIE